MTVNQGCPGTYIATVVNGQLPPLGLVDFRQKMRPELRVSSAHATQITDQDPAADSSNTIANAKAKCTFYLGKPWLYDCYGPQLTTML